MNYRNHFKLLGALIKQTLSTLNLKENTETQKRRRNVENQSKTKILPGRNTLMHIMQSSARYSFTLLVYTNLLSLAIAKTVVLSIG
jgi:hypothetical protein